MMPKVRKMDSFKSQNGKKLTSVQNLQIDREKRPIGEI